MKHGDGVHARWPTHPRLRYNSVATVWTADKLKWEQKKQDARKHAASVAGAARDYAPMEGEQAMENIRRRVDAAMMAKYGKTGR